MSTAIRSEGIEWALLIEEAVGHGNADVLKGIADGEFAEVANRWVNRSGPRFPTSSWRSSI